MESDGVSAQQQLDELERHRGEVAERLVMPVWHRALWAVTWAGTFTAVVTVDSSDWLLLVFGVFYVVWGFLAWWERRRSGVKVARQYQPMTRKGWIFSVLGVLLILPAAYLLIRHDIVWPMVVGYVAIGLGMFISARRQDRWRAEELKRS